MYDDHKTAKDRLPEKPSFLFFFIGILIGLFLIAADLYIKANL